MLHKTTAENLRLVMETNVVGTALVAAAASAVMREAGHGRIVLVASTAGLHGEPTVSAYAASKGAVIALGRTMAVEGAAEGRPHQRAPPLRDDPDDRDRHGPACTRSGCGPSWSRRSSARLPTPTRPSTVR